MDALNEAFLFRECKDKLVECFNYFKKAKRILFLKIVKRKAPQKEKLL